MKAIKVISWFLGIAMFMFGILKVLSPTINGWFCVQMKNSGLEVYVPIWVGIAGEIIVGSVLIIAVNPSGDWSRVTSKLSINTFAP